MRLSKNGADIAQKNNATTCSHDELGYYDCPLSTTDTNTLGLLKLMVHEAGALPVWHTYTVLSGAVYDSLFGETALATVGAAMTLAADQDVRNVLGSLPSVTLGASQPNYAPAKAGDAMTLTAAYDAAKTAAQPGAAMTLANDAITAAKFDETTAFPLKSADAGATAVARTGADGDTLEDLSDEIAAIPAAPSAADIKSALEATGSHLALILEDTGTSIPDSIEELAAMVEIIKVIKAHKSIENEAGTLITYRNEGDTADAGTQSWNEATKTRGEYTPS